MTGESVETDCGGEVGGVALPTPLVDICEDSCFPSLASFVDSLWKEVGGGRVDAGSEGPKKLSKAL